MLKRDHLMKATEQFFCVHFCLGGSEIPKCRHPNESLQTAHDTFYLFIYLFYYKMKFRIILNFHFELLGSKGLL